MNDFITHVELPLDHKVTMPIDESYYVTVSMIDVLKATEERNKLRELVKEMYYVIHRNNSWWDCKRKETKAFHMQLQELGIEVDE